MVQPELDSDTLLTLNRQVIVARTVSGTAHDVNNALQIIGGSADILAQNPDAPGAAQRAAARIRAQTDRAAESLRMLMELARASETVESRLTLGSVVTQALALRAHPIRRSNVTVHFDPAPSADASVRGHRAYLLQATMNLLMNAEQAVSGRPEASITIAITASADHVVLRIVDTGVGVSPAIAGVLFTPFVTTRWFPGARGLGLAATRIIAHRLGGEVTLSTRDGQTVATMTLPISEQG